MSLRELLEQLRASLNSIRVRLRLLFTRGTLTLVHAPAAGKMQTIQATGLAAEASDEIEHAQAYGMSTSPMPGAEIFLGAILGQRGQLVAFVVSDPRKEPIGKEPGEVVFWSVHGQTIKFRKDGGITMTAPGNFDFEGENVNIVARETMELKAKKILGRASELYQYGTNGHGWNIFSDHVDGYTIGAVAGTTYNITPPEVPE